MRIRKAGRVDFLAIAALDRVAWDTNRNAMFIPDGEHAWRLWVEHALVYCGCDDDDRILGAVLAFPCRDGRYCVHKVIVDAGVRNNGVGSALFEVLLSEIDTLNAAAFLTVDPANAGAMALYAKWGFIERAFVAGFYRADEDRFVLTRPARMG